MRSIRITVSRSKPAATMVGDRLLALDQALENRIEHIVGRQRILVGLVLAQFRASAARVMMFSGITRPSGPSAPSGFQRLRSRASRKTSVL